MEYATKFNLAARHNARIVVSRLAVRSTGTLRLSAIGTIQERFYQER
jgi:hypothetical protein